MARNAFAHENGTSFVNPYNFVPLSPEGPMRKAYGDWTGDLTGKIECEITIQTPICIPDSEHKQEDENPKYAGHFHYPFMRLDQNDDKTAFIPASEIRGMIRSVYEAATDSCMSILEDSPLTGRNNSFVRNQGLIRKENQQWTLTNVEMKDMVLLPTFGDRAICRQGTDEKGVFLVDKNNKKHYHCEKVYFRFKYVEGRNIATEFGTGDRTGYLLIAEKGLNSGGLKGHKHSHIMILPGGDAKKFILNHDEVNSLREVLKYYQDEKLNKAIQSKEHYGYKGFKVSEDDYTPVFYQRIGDRFLLSPAMQGREVYGTSLQDYVEGYIPCLSKNAKAGVCSGCALFGKIGDKEAYGGRLSFTDAVVSQEPMFEKGVLLKELSSPKASATEFYTEIRTGNGENRPAEWNYLYHRNRPKGIPELNREDQIHARGRKFYLHQSMPQYKDKKGEPTDRNSTMEIATKGSFRFQVCFFHLTEKELNTLLWCLSPWRMMNERKETLYHKIGHGRPLGLGSIRIEIVGDPEIRTVKSDENGKLNYSVVPITINTDETEKSIPEALKNLMAFSINNVSYPIGKNSAGKSAANAEAGHQWFGINRTAGSGGTGVNNSIRYVLPYVPIKSMTTEDLEKALRLPALETVPNEQAAKVSSIVDQNYQKPQIGAVKHNKTIPAEKTGVSQTEKTISVSTTVVTVGGRYWAVITKVDAGKGSVYVKMPDGRTGFLRVFNNIGRFKTGEKAYVLVNADDKVHDNWNLRLGQ